MFPLKFDAIGTHWQIDISENVSKNKELRIKNQVIDRINLFDKTYSRFLPDSWVSSTASQKGTHTVPEDFQPLFEIYEKLNSTSNGLLTPLIGKVMEDAGYDRSYTLKQKKELVSPPSFTKTLKLEKNQLTVSENILLDFGAAGKGYLVDIIGELISNDGIKEFCIDAGGDIIVNGSEATRIGLEHPDDPTLAIGVAEIRDQSICGSSGNRRKWGNFHHTINPLTLKSPDEIKSVWVVADKAMVADALTTCLTLDPNPTNYIDFNFEYVMLYKDNRALKSPNFPGEIFSN